eukprot:Transcript_7880.p4 GENE.Transcript_7880~~Transcript_7880.p4  ORF type:complete len:124 (+),score=0.85 Transcript_7880:863-1234(+)
MPACTNTHDRESFNTCLDKLFMEHATPLIRHMIPPDNVTATSHVRSGAVRTGLDAATGKDRTQLAASAPAGIAGTNPLSCIILSTPAILELASSQNEQQHEPAMTRMSPKWFLLIVLALSSLL